MADFQLLHVFLAFFVLAASVGCKTQTFGPATQLTAACIGIPNALGLGTDCSNDASACSGTPAPVCSAEYSAAKPAICTLPCKDDAQCGAGGSCQHDRISGISLCMPAACFSASEATQASGSSDSCPPKGANDAGVGAPCSKGGNQCANTTAPYCTVDYAAIPAAFCTKTCTADADCGNGASCASESGLSLRACVPNACLAATDSNTTTDSNTLNSNDTLAGNGNTVGACPPATTNGDGVGKVCTRGGSQCNGTTAPYCSVDYIDTAYAFCTKTCAADSDCGTDASCQSDPGGSGLKACIPSSCEAAVVSNPNVQTKSCAGNSRGVGKSCTAGGSQCEHTQATLCSANVDAQLPGVCTKFCNNTASCGSQATCVTSSEFAGLAVCVPSTACIAPEN